MDSRLDWWNKKHQKYDTEDWINKPSIFVEWAVKYFPKSGKILEIGAGHGQDSRYLADHGYQIVSTDFSETAVEYNQQKTPENLKGKITIIKIDVSEDLPFDSNTFDVVYCHLSLHYFNDLKTGEIFSEIYRVLKPGGIFAVLVNSVDDPEYGQGKELGPDFFELSPGDIKHYFSLSYMAEKTKTFETIVLDNHGTTHKDNAKGVTNLIRFIGRKPN